MRSWNMKRTLHFGRETGNYHQFVQVKLTSSHLNRVKKIGPNGDKGFSAGERRCPWAVERNINITSFHGSPLWDLWTMTALRADGGVAPGGQKPVLLSEVCHHQKLDKDVSRQRVHQSSEEKMSSAELHLHRKIKNIPMAKS